MSCVDENMDVRHEVREIHSDDDVILPCLASVSVCHMEDGFQFRVPGHDFMKALSSNSVQHEFQQVEFDWLLNEDYVIL